MVGKVKNMLEWSAEKFKGAKTKVMMTAGTATAGLSAMALSATPASASSVVPDFSGVNVGFTAGDLLSGSTGFYTLFIGFVILVLSVKFAPALIDFLFNIIGKARGRKSS